jgi:copper chaperone CopZ
MPTAKLKVGGMRTADDERNLAAAVRALAGVYGVVASCRDHCMEIDFEDDEVGVDDLLAAASAAGYPATLVG